MKAYPFMHKHPTSGQTTMSDGMDLRDYFAGQALQGLLANPKLQQQILKEGGAHGGWIELSAWGFADAMMKAREVKNDQP